MKSQQNSLVPLFKLEDKITKVMEDSAVIDEKHADATY